MNAAEIEDRFAYHHLDEAQVAVVNALRAMMTANALELLTALPPCRERHLAVEKLEEAAMWTNKAVARHGVSEAAAAAFENSGVPMELADESSPLALPGSDDPPAPEDSELTPEEQFELKRRLMMDDKDND